MKKCFDLEEFSSLVPHVAISRTSLDVEPEAIEQDYTRLEQMLDAVGGAVLFWWGDYLNHLASARGVEYAEAKAASSYDANTLKTAAWVCRHVARSRRSDRLSYSHHREVAPLSPTDQELWLTLAEDEEMSVKELRAAIRRSKAQVTNGADQSPEDQRAARASASFEEFSMWYQLESPGFSVEQRQEWDGALRPLVVSYLAGLSDGELADLRTATMQEAQG